GCQDLLRAGGAACVLLSELEEELLGVRSVFFLLALLDEIGESRKLNGLARRPSGFAKKLSRGLRVEIEEAKCDHTFARCARARRLVDDVREELFLLWFERQSAL